METSWLWHQAIWSQLYQQYQIQRLPHALLFAGASGLGKYRFATRFAQTLLCRQVVDAKPCQHCRDCCLVAAATHPAFFYLAPEKDSKTIKIEQIRGMVHQLQQTVTATYKVVIINPADSLPIAAANALLKTLEEPTERTLFMLITARAGGLLPTIRSRCQWVRFMVPKPDLAKRWLEQQLLTQTIDIKGDRALFVDELYDFAAAAPLQALAYVQTGKFHFYQDLLESIPALVNKKVDPIQLAERYLKADLSFLLYALMYLIRRIIGCKLQSPTEKTRASTSLTLLANQLSFDFLFSYFDHLVEVQRQQTKVALNPQLLLEDLFCHWPLQQRITAQTIGFTKDPLRC